VGLDRATAEAAGLFEGCEDPEDRWALVQLLDERGVTLAEMVEAHAHDGLLRAGGDRIIRPGAGRYTLAELAEQVGIDVDRVRRAWRTLGAVEPEPGVGVASDDDVELLSIAARLLELLGEDTAWPLLRRYRAAIDQIAQASSAALITEIPELYTTASGSEAVTAARWNEVADLVPELGRLLDLTLRHHVDSVRRDFEAATFGGPAVSLALGIGFADLSGYTAASLEHGLHDVGAVVAAFEGRAGDVVDRRGGRLVKFVGDAVLFVAHDADALVEMAIDIVAPLDTGGLRLTARAGVAHGVVLARDGDYFGPPVNLAARLVGVAPHGGVVGSDDLLALLEPGRWRVDEQPPAQLHGIADPVIPHLLTRAGGKP
jgi:class 3 adenylate cyclase